jgi:hypothetical protein
MTLTRKIKQLRLALLWIKVKHFFQGRIQIRISIKIESHIRIGVNMTPIHNTAKKIASQTVKNYIFESQEYRLLSPIQIRSNRSPFSASRTTNPSSSQPTPPPARPSSPNTPSPSPSRTNSASSTPRPSRQGWKKAGFFWAFRVFWFFLGLFFLYIFAQKREFSGFSVSRILLGASRL